ncbi:MAG: zf-TFIIB domain-containing protein [Gammaproteobacteria bacterium]
MKCPKCSAEMSLVRYSRHQVQRCGECHGLWFKTADLAVLRRDDWMANYILDKGKAREGRKFDRVEATCPECGSRLKRESDKRQPHIFYDTCPNSDGTFLDAGEFTDLVKETIWDKFKPVRG